MKLSARSNNPKLQVIKEYEKIVLEKQLRLKYKDQLTKLPKLARRKVLNHNDVKGLIDEDSGDSHSPTEMAFLKTPGQSTFYNELMGDYHSTNLVLNIKKPELPHLDQISH